MPGFVLWSALAVIAPGVLLHCRAPSLGGRKVSQLGHASHRHPSCLATGRKQEPVMDRRLSPWCGARSRDGDGTPFHRHRISGSTRFDWEREGDRSLLTRNLPTADNCSREFCFVLLLLATTNRLRTGHGDEIDSWMAFERPSSFSGVRRHYFCCPRLSSLCFRGAWGRKCAGRSLLQCNAPTSVLPCAAAARRCANPGRLSLRSVDAFPRS